LVSGSLVWAATFVRSPKSRLRRLLPDGGMLPKPPAPATVEQETETVSGSQEDGERLKDEHVGFWCWITGSTETVLRHLMKEESSGDCISRMERSIDRYNTLAKGKRLPAAIRELERIDRTRGEAQEKHRAGFYKEARALLQPLLHSPALLHERELERDMVSVLADCYRRMGDDKGALPHALRYVELEKDLHGELSHQHASALKCLSCTYLHIEMTLARNAISWAQNILETLGLQHHMEYGSVLLELGSLVKEQEGPTEALEVFLRSKAVLVNFQENTDWAHVLGGII
jgi:hypothetical protein